MHHQLALLIALAALTASANAQTPPAVPPEAATAEPQVRVPIFPNSTCPIMGKKVSTKLFIDIEFGRIYICCKGCDKKILRAPELAYQTAFPTVEAIDNPECPISGQPIGEDAVTVSLQGVTFRVARAEHAAAAIADAQVVLNKLKDPSLVDIGNKICPISGGPVQPNTFVLIGKHIVRLASPSQIEAVEKTPTATLAKARELARAAAAESKPDAGAERERKR